MMADLVDDLKIVKLVGGDWNMAGL